MAEVTIPKEKINYTIDLLITMVTDEIAEETGRDRKEILTDFLCAKRKDFGQGFYLTTSKEQAIRRQTISASDSCCPIN